jgi:hypothetical protein
VRRICLSNIASVSEKDSTGLAIGTACISSTRVRRGVVECLQENGKGVQGRCREGAGRGSPGLKVVPSAKWFACGALG